MHADWSHKINGLDSDQLEWEKCLEELLKKHLWLYWKKMSFKQQDCCNYMEAPMQAIQHNMSCKKGVFVTISRNNLRDLTAKILSEVCNNTKNEAKLVPLSGEDLSNWTTNRFNQVRRYTSTGFWEGRQQAFFDLKGSKPNTCQYLNKSLQQYDITNGNEKKRAYNESTATRPWHIYAIGFFHLRKYG